MSLVTVIMVKYLFKNKKQSFIKNQISFYNIFNRNVFYKETVIIEKFKL